MVRERTANDRKNNLCFLTSHLTSHLQTFPKRVGTRKRDREPRLVSYLLQQAFGFHITGPDWHLQSHDVLEVPQEVGGVCVGFHYIHKGVVSRQQAGDDRKLSPVVLLHQLEQRDREKRFKMMLLQHKKLTRPWFHSWSSARLSPAGSGWRCNCVTSIQKKFHQCGTFPHWIIRGLTQIVTPFPKTSTSGLDPRGNLHNPPHRLCYSKTITPQGFPLVRTWCYSAWEIPGGNICDDNPDFPLFYMCGLILFGFFQSKKYILYLEHAEDLLLQRRPHL